jgi:hypothetical protein
MSDTTGQNNGTAASVGRALDRLRGRGGAQGAAAHDAGGLEALSAQREELAAKVAELTWDLGGLTYEMAIRDHFRLDVLVRRAAVLQEVDAELGEVERLLAAAEEGVTGQCRSCGAVHSRGAVYCWKCGQPLMLQAQSSLVPSSVPANAPAAPHAAG